MPETIIVSGTVSIIVTAKSEGLLKEQCASNGANTEPRTLYATRHVIKFTSFIQPAILYIKK